MLIDCAPLQPPSASTTVQVRDGETLLTDGPAAEIKEHFGGFTLIECADLDEALKWAACVPTASDGRVEVRPLVQVVAPADQPGHSAGPPVAELGEVFRAHWWAAVAAVTRQVGDLTVAEDAVQDACAAALAQWPAEGPPANPRAWLIGTARHKALDRIGVSAAGRTRRPRPCARRHRRPLAGGAAEHRRRALR